jgi:carboxyl-terminal processing protease
MSPADLPCRRPRRPRDLAACARVPGPGGAGDPDIALYRNVIAQVRTDYVEPVGEDKLVTNSLKGMLNGLDPHSDYMTESEYQDMLDDSQGEFAGIGAELTREDIHPQVIAPIEDTPAARAGIRSGDVILKIDGKATDGMSLKDVVDALRGPPGSPVTMTIGRRGRDPFDVTLRRAIIRVASVKWKLEPGRIGYARITSFAEKTQSEFLAALAAMEKEAGGPLDGFVLDLRNDPGGLLDEAVQIAGDFLDGGTVVSTKGRDADDNRRFPAPDDGDRLKGVPVVVLINGASASASEIVAGALQDRHRAVILGTRSFGKGSVQTIIPLDGRGALRLTTARYYTPSGRSIQAEGIVPDRIVALAPADAVPGTETLREADLRGALDTGKGASAKRGRIPADTTKAEDDASIDPTIIGTSRDQQLATALAEVRDLGRRPVARSQPRDGR